MLRAARSLIATVVVLLSSLTWAQLPLNDTIFFGNFLVNSTVTGTSFRITDLSGLTFAYRDAICPFAEHAIGPNDPSPVTLNTQVKCSRPTYFFEVVEWTSSTDFVLKISHTVLSRGSSYVNSAIVSINCQRNPGLCSNLTKYRLPFDAGFTLAPADMQADPAHLGGETPADNYYPVVTTADIDTVSRSPKLPALVYISLWDGYIEPAFQVADLIDGTLAAALCIMLPVDLTTQNPPVSIGQSVTCNTTDWSYSITSWTNSSDFTLGILHTVKDLAPRYAEWQVNTALFPYRIDSD